MTRVDTARQSSPDDDLVKLVWLITARLAAIYQKDMVMVREKLIDVLDSLGIECLTVGTLDYESDTNTFVFDGWHWAAARRDA